MFHRFKNLADMTAYAIAVAKDHEGKVFAESGIYTDNSGLTFRPQVTLVHADTGREVAVLRWYAYHEVDATQIDFMGKRARVEAREASDWFVNWVQEALTRHYEDAAPAGWESVDGGTVQEQQVWTIEGKRYIEATQEQIKALQALPGAPHVMFGCKCGHAYWTAKNIALSDSGRYNGARNIFYAGRGAECACPGSNLVCIEAEA